MDKMSCDSAVNKCVNRLKKITLPYRLYSAIGISLIALTTVIITVSNAAPADKSTETIVEKDHFTKHFYAYITSNPVTNIADLVDCYLQDQNIFAYIAPPAADITLFQSGRSIYIPDESYFSRKFIKGVLDAQAKDTFRTTLMIYEDAASPGRELVMENDLGSELVRLERETDYSSDWVVRKIYPNFDVYTPEYQSYLASIFDPGRIVMYYKVIIGEANLIDYLDMVALERQAAALAAPIMMAMSSQISATNLMFTAIKPQTNNTVELTIGWPDIGLATNKLEIFTCENLNTGLWSITDVETIDLSTNRHVWVDDDGYTNRQSRFYECWLLNDDDGDGISDGRETRLYFTNINTNDSDGDGIGDYVEIFESVYTNTTFSTISYGTNPNEVDSDGDGLTDKEEREYGTDPWRSDSDGDESDDFDEVNNFYLFAWGVNENISSFYIPVAEPLALSSYHTDGSKALCLNEEGGVSEFRTWRTYVAPPEFATNFIAVAAGASHRSAITDSGALVSWWSGADEPMQNENFEAPVEQVACGWGHTVALLTNKSVRSYYYYGYSYAGQTNQPLGMAAAEAVAAGNKHSLALLDDGHVVAWGRNYHGQTNVPVNVTNAVAIAAGENHSAALLDDGSVVVWGDDSDNQVTHAALATNAVQLACGKNNCIILRWDNTVFAWGDGCGDGDKTNLVFETPVLAVRAGGYGCAVILENGETFMVNVRQPDYLRVKDCQTIGNGSAAALAATNPIDPDTDGDTLPDKWEIENGLNPFSDYDTIAPYNNADNDDLTNLQEYQYGTHPLLSDTDDDGIDDDDEVNGPTDPLNPDSDFDNLKDGDERLYGTDPMIPDCDGDTLLDGDEINIHKSSPLHVDSDNDGLYDQEEVNIYFTTPGHPDTDDDGLPDPWELYFGFNPLVWDDSSIDSDGDGLTNKEEANIYTITRSASPMTMGLSSAVAMSIPLDLGFGWSLTGLSPFLADSDWDGTLDSHDVDPLDYLRRDVANDNNTVKTTLQVGDPSASHSEKYAISVGPYRVHMPHVNNSSYMFEATYSVPRGQTFSGAVTSLYDDDDDGDYAAYVIGSGFTITPSGVLGDYDDTGFNAGSKSFTVTTPDATPADTAADSASKDPDKANKADPVNAISGNVTITRTDAVLNCPGVPLTFGRYYNSSTLFGGGPLGPGWSHSYEIRLGGDETNTIYKAVCGTIRRMHLPDGRTYAFSKSNGVYTAADDIEISLESYGVDQWSVSRPGGFEWIFNNDGLILSMSDGKGNSLAMDYLVNIDTGVKYLSEIEHSNGASLYLSYTNFPMRSTFLDGLYSDDPNWIVNYGYDASGRLSDSTRATLDNKEYGETYLYEDVGFCLTQRVNAAGTTFNYTYADIERNGVEQRFGASTWLDDNAFRTDFNYHPNAISNTTRYVAHRSVGETISSLLTWDTNTWQVTSEINEEDGSGYEYIYDDDNNLVREAIFHNALTSSVTRVFDSRHNVLREAAALGTTPVYTQNANFYQWHPTLSLPLTLSDSENITNHFTWSDSGLLLKAYNTHSTNTFGYTANGQISAVTNANGHATTLSYDTLGHPYLITPHTGPTYKILHDANGYLTNSALPTIGGGWKSTTYANDTYGRLKSVTYPDGIAEYIHRNGAGVVTSTVDRAGNRAAYTYAAGNKLTSVTNWLDATTPVGISFDYDWQMNNLTVINPMGYAIETYTLDAQERVERVTNLEDQQLDVTYLVGGLISSIDRFDGVLVSNIFDIAGNIVETLHDGTSIEQASYRKNGQLLSISNAYATCVYSHDTRGFVTNVTQSTGNNLQSSVGYAFDPAGNTTNVLWNVGSGTLNVAYGYDEAERLALQSDSAGEFAYTYNPYNGALGALSNDNITVDYTFDILDAVTNVVYRDGTGNEIASFDYKHDVLGLITQKVSVINGIATTNSYIFDNMGRLLSEHTNPNPQTPNPVSYTYDLAGNRLTAGSSTYTYTHNKLDGVHHDVAGNITKMVQNGIMLDMNWNSRGQLTSVSTNGVFTESYTWGPLGNRLSTTDARGTTYHAYDGAHCIADYNSSGDLIASYTWGSGVDNLLAVTVYGNGSTNKYYAIKDHLGSVHALIDEFCNTVMTVTYNAWGTPLNSSLSLQNSSFLLRYLFQGREYSHATGLYNFRARWYDSNIGRWLSKDPVGLEGGLNFYVFCGNDPVNFVDPWGECEIEIGFIDELASVLSEPIDIALSKIGTAIGTIRNSILGEPELDPNETPVFEPGRPQFLTGDDLMDLAYLAMTRSGGKPPSGNSKATSQAAAKLGYNRRIPPQKAPFSSHGKPAYQKGNRYITPDADSHKGGAWKKFDNKGRRMGTYDANLKTRIGN